MKAFKVGTIALLTSGLLFGCSASVDTKGVEDQLKPTENSEFENPSATVQGPNIDGQWKSNCNYSFKNDNYRTLTITAKGNKIERIEEQFEDSRCTTSLSIQKYAGKFRFIEKLKNDIYKTEYAFAIGGGVTTFPKENLKKTNEALYIGDFRAGEGMGVISDEPLYFVGTKKDSNEKEKDQSETGDSNQAKVATSYSEAKYAMCDLQGNQYIVDLSGLDLTESKRAPIKFGLAYCDGRQVEWIDKDFTGIVIQENNFPQITFSTGSSDGITTWKEGNGLNQNGYARKTKATVEGNSGFCYFLETPNIKNLTHFCK